MTLPIPDVLNIPLFPLPGVVLFPGTVLPLRVFEPRYVELLKDVLAAEQLIGMAQLKPASFTQSNPAGPFTPPPIYDVLGVGRVVASQELDDGTWHIALLGQARCRIECEAPYEPYRIARVTTLRDTSPEAKLAKAELARLRAKMIKSAAALATTTFENEAAEQFQAALKERRDIGAMTDLLASIFIHEAALRQKLLEINDVLSRARILTAIVETLLGRAEPKPPPIVYSHDDICLN
jgi:uncharacterized protein